MFASNLAKAEKKDDMAGARSAENAGSAKNTGSVGGAGGAGKARSAKAVAKKVWDGITMVLVVATVAVAVLLVGGRVLGLQNYIVLTGSMTPAYPAGSLVYVQEVDASELSVGDAITFRLTDESVATHRIAEVLGSGDDAQFRTKGDANAEPDGALVPASDVVGKVVFALPYLGQLSAYMQTAAGKAVAICYGAFLLLMFILPELLLAEGGSGGKRVKRGKHARN